MTLLAIPDIHGRKGALEEVLARADRAYGTGARIVFLGDLVDRGEDSRGVIELLMDGIERGRDWIVLRGNHDQLCADFLTMAEAGGHKLRAGSGWLSDNIGGRETLRSYGLTELPGKGGWPAVARAVPRAHRSFLENLPHSYETEEQIFVHAGIRPGVPLAEQERNDLIWIRDAFLDDRRDHGKLIVHGHTSCPEPEHHGNRVNLDGGAGWGRPLHVARLEGRKVWLLTESGEVQLEP